MTNGIFIGQKASYKLGKEIGIGGEGQVFEVVNQPNLALKLYNNPISPYKLEKLLYMTAISTPQVETYSAWPLDIIKNNENEYCGFVMRKLKGYVPLHNLFSPMDRKRLFPDKGYNFLVHVARNLATAFHALHAAQLIVGDVNEGNIFVDAKGMIAFIDCDSFQIKQGNQYHYCEVGIPRYTPPELLRNDSFTNVIRTANTDSFSLAILIFQLLFLGRHPFAGKSNAAIDIDEEIAIRNQWFAYSLHPNQQILVPPNDSFPFNYLPNVLQNNFQQSFEEEENNRPLPINWIVALDSYLKLMVSCIKSPIHIYPSTFNECPWCAFSTNRNINYFIERNYAQNETTHLDIDQFILNLKPEKIIVPKLKLAVKSLNQISALPIPKKCIQYKKYNYLSLFIILSLSCLLLFINIWMALIGLLGSLSLNYILPFKRYLQVELNKRINEKDTLQAQLLQYIEVYNNPKELTDFLEESKQLLLLLKQYKTLPSLLESLQSDADERLYNQQLNEYLAGFSVVNLSIPDSKIKALIAEGIKAASDITKLKMNKVVGIGSTYQKQLFNWHSKLKSGFVYRPNVALLNKEYAMIMSQTNRDKLKLEEDVLNLNNQLKATKTRVLAKQQQLQITISIIEEQAKQALLNYEIYDKWLHNKQ